MYFSLVLNSKLRFIINFNFYIRYQVEVEVLFSYFCIYLTVSTSFVENTIFFFIYLLLYLKYHWLYLFRSISGLFSPFSIHVSSFLPIPYFHIYHSFTMSHKFRLHDSSIFDFPLLELFWLIYFLFYFVCLSI